jgi:hypothetical protein
VVLFELLAGRRPFVGASYGAVVMQILGGKAPPLEGVPPAIAALVARALEPERERRFPSMRALLDEVRACVAARDVPQLAPPVATGPRRRRALAAAAIAVLAVGLVGARWAIRRARHAPASPVAAVAPAPRVVAPAPPVVVPAPPSSVRSPTPPLEATAPASEPRRDRSASPPHPSHRSRAPIARAAVEAPAPAEPPREETPPPPPVRKGYSVGANRAPILE